MLTNAIGWSPMRTATWARDRAPIRQAIADLSHRCPTCAGQRMLLHKFEGTPRMIPVVCPTCNGRGHS